ncbi:MAG: ATP-binding protein [Anaerolineaceae bacterium]|nr:ATP-binding protein [Anaerolineaceae bacterium]
MLNLDVKNLNSNGLVSAVQLLAKINDPRIDLNEGEDRFLAGLAPIFKNQFAILVLTDPQGGPLADRKVMTSKSAVPDTDQVNFTSGLLFQSYQDLKLVFQQGDPRGVNPAVDAPEEVQVTSIACAPLVYHSNLFGILAIGNFPADSFSDEAQVVFAHLLDSLAARIHSAKLIEELQASNSELLATQQQLLHSRNTLRTLFDNIPDSFYIVDENYYLVAINQSRAERSGVTPQHVVGQHCYEGLYQYNSPCPGCLVAKTLKNKASTVRKLHLLQKDNSNLEWEIRTYPVQAAENGPRQVVLLEQNITEKQRMEAELIQSEKLAAVGQLAAGVAHEINNPLTSILANAQMLIEDLPEDREDLQQSARLIEAAGLKATQVVKNLLGSVRKEDFDFEPVDLNDSIQSALMLLSHEFLSRQITVQFHRDSDMPQIVASENYLQSAWINLIMNSIEAIEGESGEIRIASKFDGSNFLVKISDNGKGIPGEYLNQIFEPFFTTKKKNDKGTGLGLSLVRRVVQSHNGQIQVESEEGRGTTFTIILPKEPKGK